MNSHPKIIILGTAYPFRGGGISTYNERLAKAYLDRGEDVEIYTFSLQYPKFLFPGKTQYSAEAPPPNLLIRIKVNSINPLNWLFVGREINRLKPQLLIVRYWMPFMAPCLGSICRIVRKNGFTRIISIADNINPHEKMPGSRLLTKYFVKSVDGFITMSKSVLADLETFDVLKPRLYNPHPLYDNFGESVPKKLALEKLGLDPAFRYMLFFGFIRDYKGLDILLRALGDDRIRKMPIKLIVAGEFYSNPETYMKIIDDEGIRDQLVLFNGFIPNTEVRTYFSAADLVVQPYKNATQSGVTQVAYHFNKPIITTNVGGLSETIPDGKVGFIVQPDAVQIANAIFRFFHNNLEEEFIKNVMIEKKRFSWDTMLDNISVLATQISK